MSAPERSATHDELPTHCQMIGCYVIVQQTPGAGRPRRYCTDEHRREAYNMRRSTESRLAWLREQVRRDEHLLAALGGDDERATR